MDTNPSFMCCRLPSTSFPPLQSVVCWSPGYVRLASSRATVPSYSNCIVIWWISVHAKRIVGCCAMWICSSIWAPWSLLWSAIWPHSPPPHWICSRRGNWSRCACPPRTHVIHSNGNWSRRPARCSSCALASIWPLPVAMPTRSFA